MALKATKTYFVLHPRDGLHNVGLAQNDSLQSLLVSYQLITESVNCTLPFVDSCDDFCLLDVVEVEQR